MTDKLSHSVQSPRLWALDTQATPRDLIPTKYRKIGSSCSWRRTVTAVHVTLVITLVCFVGISNCQSFLVQIKSKFGAGQDGLTVFSPRYRWHWSKSKEIIFIRIIVLMHLSMLSPRVGGGGTDYPREIDSASFSLGADFDIRVPPWGQEFDIATTCFWETSGT